MDNEDLKQDACCVQTTKECRLGILDLERKQNNLVAVHQYLLSQLRETEDRLTAVGEAMKAFRTLEEFR